MVGENTIQVVQPNATQGVFDWSRWIPHVFPILKLTEDIMIISFKQRRKKPVGGAVSASPHGLGLGYSANNE